MGTQTYHRGVLDAKIAVWTSENNWDTAYDIKGIRNASLSMVMDTDELGGDDVILDRFAVIESATLSWEQAAVDLEALDILSGGTLVSDASYEDLVIGKEGENPVYVGMALRVESSTPHTLHVLLPKCKFSGNLNFQAQYKQYLLPGAEFQAVYEGETNGILRMRKFISATALTIPLATSVD
jgi:hypothetical protein